MTLVVHQSEFTTPGAMALMPALQSADAQSVRFCPALSAAPIV